MSIIGLIQKHKLKQFATNTKELAANGIGKVFEYKNKIDNKRIIRQSELNKINENNIKHNNPQPTKVSFGQKVINRIGERSKENRAAYLQSDNKQPYFMQQSNTPYYLQQNNNNNAYGWLTKPNKEIKEKSKHIIIRIPQK